ncbi:hypothetical protein AMTRI_Chr07g23730 [Amborella trichopoda]
MDSQTMTSPTCLSPPPQESDPLLFKPVDWLIDLPSIHLNFISHFFSAISSTFYAFLSIVLECFHSTNEAQHKAEETAHQELEAISRAPFAVVEGEFQEFGSWEESYTSRSHLLCLCGSSKLIGNFFRPLDPAELVLGDSPGE